MVAMVTSITLLLAILALLGHRINALSPTRFLRRPRHSAIRNPQSTPVSGPASPAS
jgi:hypothetical protein